MKKFFATNSKPRSARQFAEQAGGGTAIHDHPVLDVGTEPSYQESVLLSSPHPHVFATSSPSYPVTYSAPPSPDPSTLFPERPVYDRLNHARSEHEWARRSPADEPWDFVHSPDPHRRDPRAPISNPYSPPMPSRSSSLGSLPLGASTPPQSFSPPPAAYHHPSGVSSDAGSFTHIRGANPITRILRKKPPSITDRASGGGGAAAILRTLDPHKQLDGRRIADSDRMSLHDSVTRHSADSFEHVLSDDEEGRSSVQLDRERQWRERDREIREAENREKGKKPKVNDTGKRHIIQLPDLGEDTSTPEQNARRMQPKDKKRKEDKKSQWAFFTSKDRERETERDRGRDSDGEESQAEQLTRMIGYLTATASEDWALVLEVCERASANEGNAKVAAKALRREFKYAEPPAQLSAARLWAIMLKNSSSIFIAQSSSRKFLDTLEDVITSSRTTPVVKERLLDVLGAASYASSGPPVTSERAERGKEGFRGLWLKVKPEGRPDEGAPLDIDSDMFATSSQQSHTPSSGGTAPSVTHGGHHRHAPHQNQTATRHEHIISAEEDMRRLFQECNIGRGNASLLSEALAFAKPEDLHEKEIIKEFYAKCRASQVLISAQIPWAFSGAERSRAQALQLDPNRNAGRDSPSIETAEEMLLADLLNANGELADALRMYDDVERIGVEREVEKASEVQVVDDIYRRSGSNLPANYRYSGLWAPPNINTVDPSRSPSRSSTQTDAGYVAEPPGLASVDEHVAFPTLPNAPSPLQSLSHSSSSQSHLVNCLLPPSRIHHGPRLPQSSGHHASRSPSPARSAAGKPLSPFPSRDNSSDKALDKAHATSRPTDLRRLYMTPPQSPSVEEELVTPVEPSAKALGKRRMMVQEEGPELPPGLSESVDFGRSNEEGPYPFESDEVDRSDADSDEGTSCRWKHPTQFVYDASAERREEWIREGKLTTVH